jgi:hypothetical protein
MAELTLAKRWTLALADARAREAAADKLSLLKRQIWNVGKYLLVMTQSCQNLAKVLPHGPILLVHARTFWRGWGYDYRHERAASVCRAVPYGGVYGSRDCDV